jgi:hypothetical protein
VLLVDGPGDAWTLAGMVDGDPATATEFHFGEGFVDVGDITLDVGGT